MLKHFNNKTLSITLAMILIKKMVEPVSLFYILILDIQKIIMSTFSYFSLAGECEGIQISSATKEKATRAKVNIIILVNIIVIKIVIIIL